MLLFRYSSFLINYGSGQMRFSVKSDTGNVREKNEDSYNIIAGYTGVPVAFIIADGMGGHNSGEVASKMAVDLISAYILQFPEMFVKELDILTSINEIMEKANNEIFLKSQENEDNYGMGTTLTLAVVYDKSLFLGHVGDSRAYLIRDEIINKITIDHSYVEELIKLGTLTREEAENHPKKNIITRALGCTEKVEIDTYSFEIKENDTFILCTDGLTNMLNEEEIKNIVIENDDPETACRKLVESANNRGGDDNITVIVFKD